MAYYPQRESDLGEMKNIFNSLHLIVKIFYDLNAQVIHQRIFLDIRTSCLFLGITRTFRR